MTFTSKAKKGNAYYNKLQDNCNKLRQNIAEIWFNCEDKAHVILTVL